MRCPNNHDGTHFRRSYPATATDHRHGPAILPASPASLTSGRVLPKRGA